MTESLWKNPIHFIACGFGAGAMPWAPGTFGTLIAIPFFWLFHTLSITQYVLLVIFLNVAGIYLCGKVNRDWGVADHSAVVWDEFAAFFITMIGLPADGLWLIAAFVLFRCLDIWKPWPIRLIDRRLHGGLGVVLDDVVAAFLTNIILQCVLALQSHS